MDSIDFVSEISSLADSRKNVDLAIASARRSHMEMDGMPPIDRQLLVQRENLDSVDRMEMLTKAIENLEPAEADAINTRLNNLSDPDKREDARQLHLAA